MSDTTTPVGLTGGPAAVYTQLVNLTGDDGITATELALAARLGRSTTGKALVTLEEQGLALRTPGGFDGPRRTADIWRPAPTPATSNDGDAVDPEPTTTEPDTDHPNAGSTPTDATPPANGDASATHEGNTPAPTTDAPDETNEHPDEDDAHKANMHRDDGNPVPEPDTTPGPAENPEEPTTAPAATPSNGKTRLAPGALRQMVTDHLNAHPGEAFTATRISRVLEKSSGAIANSLVTLTRQGIAEQVTEKPRTYRAATTETAASE